MGLQLHSVQDPRDLLDMATRAELYRFAEHSGVDEIVNFPGPGLMPKMLMLRILRSRGLTRINIPPRPLGGARPETQAQEAKNVPTTDATTDLLRQLQSNANVAPPEEPDTTEAKPSLAGIAAMRAECKRRGIKIARTDKMADLKAKLDGEDAFELNQ